MFTATTTTSASPEQVLSVLTDPGAISDWSPVPFEAGELDDGRLERGTQTTVRGSLGGLSVEFEVEVLEADADRLELVARGPVSLEVRYDLVRAAAGSEVRASIGVTRGRGITGRVIAKATEGLLAAGALQGAAGRIARAAEAAAPAPA